MPERTHSISACPFARKQYVDLRPRGRPGSLVLFGIPPAFCRAVAVLSERLLWKQSPLDGAWLARPPNGKRRNLLVHLGVAVVLHLDVVDILYGPDAIQQPDCGVGLRMSAGKQFLVSVVDRLELC